MLDQKDPLIDHIMSDNNNTLLEKIEGLKVKLDQIQAQLSDPESMADMKKYVQLNKDYKEIEPIVKAGARYKKEFYMRRRCWIRKIR